MKRNPAFGLALALILTAGGFFAHAAATPPAPKKLLTGELNCLFCFMTKPESEGIRADCVEHCITKRGMSPVLIEEGTGEAYVIVWKDGNSAVAKVQPLLGKKVNIQGVVYEKKGVRVIEASMIAEAL